jgi:hypothetical protein
MKHCLHLFRIILFIAFRAHADSAEVDSVGAVDMTVSDMDRAVAFYSALSFQKVSDREWSVTTTNS